MGFMFRVRLSSFLAGAAAASVGGFYYLYKDYLVAQQAISQQSQYQGKEGKLRCGNVAAGTKQQCSCTVKDNYEALEGRYEALNARVAALEHANAVEITTTVEGSE